jgi:IS5 family transposase
MKQTSFAQAEFAAKKKITRRERFLAEMEQVVPWSRLLKALSPYYYPDSRGKRGRPPTPLKRMLRMYFVQQWYALADEALEDAIYDSQALRDFVGIDLGVESVPDATTLLKFRHLLEKQALTQVIFEQINDHLAEHGMLMREGTIVDATIIAAPPSTKNRAKARDPEMHQAKKGNEWHFGMKAHIGTDADSGLVHSLTGTAANVADITESEHLLHGDETEAYADAGYTGVAKRPEFQGSDVVWHVAEKRGKLKKMEEGPRKTLTAQRERVKAQIRAKVEHPFHVVKNLFRHRKVRYRGLLKNTAQLFTLFGLANLVLARRINPSPSV